MPVIRDADGKSFAEIERAIDDFVSRAESRKLWIENLRGGTCTISNGGVFGSLLSTRTPILNPPRMGVLASTASRNGRFAYRGEVALRPVMHAALSYDHRMFDGSTAVRFLGQVKEVPEAPESLLF